MRLDEYVDHVLAMGQKRPRKDVIRELAEASGVAYQTLAQAERGARLSLYDKAAAVARATGYVVSVIELCDPAPAEMLARLREPHGFRL